MNPDIYIFASACLLFVLAVVWDKDTWLNVLVKVLLSAYSVWGFLTWLK